jgi:hypothetical protein
MDNQKVSNFTLSFAHFLAYFGITLRYTRYTVESYYNGLIGAKGCPF